MAVLLQQVMYHVIFTSTGVDDRRGCAIEWFSKVVMKLFVAVIIQIELFIRQSYFKHLCFFRHLYSIMLNHIITVKMNRH